MQFLFRLLLPSLLILIFGPVTACAQAIAYIPETYAYATDSTIIIPIEVENIQGLNGGQFLVTYSSLVIAEVLQIRKTNLSLPYSLFSNNSYADSVRVNFSAAFPVDVGSGTFLNLVILLKPGLRSGMETPLNFLNFFWYGLDGGENFVTARSGKLTIIGVAQQRGDMNQDGQINLPDLLRVVESVLERGRPLTDFERWAADADSDGRLSDNDIEVITRRILGF